MTTYIKQLSPSNGNAIDANKRVWLVQEQPKSFRWPYAGWNKGGADTTKAETLEAALVAFGLTAYTAPVQPVQPVNPDVVALRRKYLDATAALCALAGQPYTGKLTDVQYDATATAASDKPQSGVLVGTLVYCAARLRELDGKQWWERIEGL